MRQVLLVAIFALLAAFATAQGAPSILSAAEQWEGTPYLFGGAGDPNNMGPNGAGIDCSHLVWRAITESVEPSFQYMDTAEWAASTPGGFTPESCDSANNGDIVLFNGHIGVSSGPGAVYSATSHGVRNGQISWFGSPIGCFTWSGSSGGGSSSGGVDAKAAVVEKLLKLVEKKVVDPHVVEEPPKKSSA